MSSIRPHVRDLVELCVHVREARTAPSESLRKVRWKRGKQKQQRLAELQRLTEDQDLGDGQGSTDPPPSETLSLLAVHDPLPSELRPSKPASGIAKDVGAARSLDELVAEIQRRDVEVSCRPVRGDPSDPLGALSVPCKRDGNSLTLCRLSEEQRLLVVFGGRVLQDAAVLRPSAVENKDPVLLERIRYTFSNAVYVLDMATQLWRFQECSGKPPKERCDHSALFLASRFLLVYGGRGRSGQVFGDLHALSLETWRWSQVEHERAPTERYWHGWCASDSVSDSASVFLFGGRSDALVFGDLAQLRASSVVRWLDTQQQQQPEPPTAPASVSEVIAMENDQIAIVGGWRDTSRGGLATTETKLLDVHILDAVTQLWSTPRLSSLVCASPAVPAARMLFECFYADQTLVVFGGHSYAQDGESEPFTGASDATQALYLLDVSRMIWRRQELPLPPPHVHNSGANVMAAAKGGGYVGITCSTSSGVGEGGSDKEPAAAPPLELQLHAFDLPFH